MKSKCDECFIHVSGEDPVRCSEEWCKDAQEYLEGAKNTEQQVQPDIGDAPAILDNTVELDGVLYRV